VHARVESHEETAVRIAVWRCPRNTYASRSPAALQVRGSMTSRFRAVSVALVPVLALLIPMFADPHGLLTLSTGGKLRALAEEHLPAGSRFNPHRVSLGHFSYAYDAAATPVLKVASGDIVEVTSMDASSGQVRGDLGLG
jgi:hypothetical protein